MNAAPVPVTAPQGKSAPSVPPVVPQNPIVQPTVVAPPSNPVAKPKIDLETARKNLESARVAAADRLHLDYAGAKAAAAQTDQELNDARKKFGIGSPELIAAGQRRMDADSALRQIESRLASDPQVVTAEQEMKTASNPLLNR